VHSDHLGTPRAVVTQAAAVLWRWDGEAFGNSMANEDADNDGQSLAYNLRFPGQYFDRETNLHYNWNRTYDPGIGAYHETEPLGLAGDINLYRYARNNPLRYIDPDGNQATLAISATGGGASTTGAASLLGPGAAVIGAGLAGYGVGTLIYPIVESPIATAVDWCASAMSGSGRWSCTASCNVQVINPGLGGKVPSRVTGSAKGKTESEACVEAKRVATQSAPRGTYARHCQCSSCSKN